MPLRAMNDLTAHNASLAGELSAAVTRVLDSGWYVLGREVAAFEEAFAAHCGVPHAIGVGNGTDALELALAGVGIGRGDRVALVANAGGYGTAAVRALGAIPVYVDVSPETWLLDPVALDRALSGGVGAVIVTHLYGRLADMAALSAVAARHGVKIVEDCAQAHGAARDGRRAGSFGAAAAFSFYPTKNLGALGDAGVVVTADPAVAERVTRLRQYGWDRKYRMATGPGRNSRLDEIQAAVLRVKLPHLDAWNARRVALARRYTTSITHPKVALPVIEAPWHVAHLFVVRTADRDGLAAHLRAHGVPSETHYPIPDHRQPGFGDRFADVSLPVTEQLCAETLSLPCYPEMSDADADLVATAVDRWEV
ncbi:DegT/DnrJ/EryC1/StrS family aminotransferase [Dactylosporangium roseum]|uniref:DegT/DnrJ/EryC1/StrS family aminotransferase n=1 Tax=Dactylosporangium roseum TaxID=47989 RepID=A0ABY5Z2K6_9ACTN|nr:DegT/DnrJ/EryC1/StrS family aminotransferase [Dactylosporangium roseum]UWZ35112.1 DegT/DnrJ/EryC1/StrS family aminotransferase [Dactylosporangium roseum]